MVIYKVPSSSWNNINKAINLIPIKNEDIQSIDINVIKNSLLSVIELLKSKENDVNDFDLKKFKENFGRLNFRFNFIKQQLDKKDYDRLKDVQIKINLLAKEHGIRPYRPYLQNFKGTVKKIVSMHSHGSKESLDHAQRNTKILSEEYWKEFFDLQHRHPKTLDKFFSDWKVYGHGEKVNFWDYLKEIEISGKAPELMNVNEQVMYLDENQRKEYATTLKMDNGKIILLDSQGKQLPDGVYITVLGPNRKFYAAKKQPGKFQHASFFGGKSVITAGMFVIKNGVLENFLSQSGHYKPEKEEMCKAVYYMEKMGLDVSKFNLIYSSGGEESITIDNPKEWEEYKNFLAGKNQKTKISPDHLLLNKIPAEEKLDLKAGQLIQKIGGGYYNEDLGAIMPIRSTLVNSEWETHKNNIARVVGILPNPATVQSMVWTNSAKSKKELLDHSQLMSAQFKKMCDSIAQATNSQANFGPGDKCIVKSMESLSRKVAQDAKIMNIPVDLSLSKIGDALRGTIIVDEPKQIREVTNLVIDKVKKAGGEVVFKNLWAEERQSGYVGVHAKISLPLPASSPEDKSEGSLIVELQIHLKDIMDGTEECVKEREHRIYDKVRVGTFDPLQASTASKLLYLTALQNIKTLGNQDNKKTM